MKTGKYIEDGIEYWYLNGKRHRTDGPAIIYHSGSQYWYLNDKLHRTDGPAVIYPDGTQYWYLNGKYHRTDGPAVTYPNRNQKWYLNDKEVNEDTFNLLLTCTIEDLGKYFFSPKYKDYKYLIEDRLRRNKV